ncbi:MAG: hypothetical protein ABIG90_00820 [bacterium]
MIYIIDFDGVLFDVSKFKNACQKQGIDFSDKIYEKSKTNNIYNPIKHLKLLGKSKKDLIKILKQSKKFLFSGITKKLKKLSKHNKLILLSKGSLWFQKQKIKYSGLEKFFNKIYITEISKLEVFQEKIMPKYGQEKMIFIDDKKQELDAIKKIYPQIKSSQSLFFVIN